MSGAETAPSLSERILSTGDRELQLLAADGALPLPTDELLPIQVALAGSGRSRDRGARAPRPGSDRPPAGGRRARQHHERSGPAPLRAGLLSSGDARGCAAPSGRAPRPPGRDGAPARGRSAGDPAPAPGRDRRGPGDSRRAGEQPRAQPVRPAAPRGIPGAPVARRPSRTPSPSRASSPAKRPRRRFSKRSAPPRQRPPPASSIR